MSNPKMSVSAGWPLTLVFRRLQNVTFGLGRLLASYAARSCVFPATRSP
jgi:hypothetical protein